MKAAYKDKILRYFIHLSIPIRHKYSGVVYCMQKKKKKKKKKKKGFYCRCSEAVKCAWILFLSFLEEKKMSA